MKLTVLFAFAVLGSSIAFAAAPTDMDLIQALDAHYAANVKYENCVTQLDGGKPISVPVAYLNRLTAAAYAEGVTAACK